MLQVRSVTAGAVAPNNALSCTVRISPWLASAREPMPSPIACASVSAMITPLASVRKNSGARPAIPGSRPGQSLRRKCAGSIRQAARMAISAWSIIIIWSRCSSASSTASPVARCSAARRTAAVRPSI